MLVSFHRSGQCLLDRWECIIVVEFTEDTGWDMINFVHVNEDGAWHSH